MVETDNGDLQEIAGLNISFSTKDMPSWLKLIICVAVGMAALWLFDDLP